MRTSDLRKALMKKSEIPVLTRDQFLSSGCTTLNLACSNRYYGCFLKGKYYLFVGDSASGKTALSLTCLAEAANNENFDDYRIILDDVEGGNLFDVPKLFGKKLNKRIEYRRSTSLEEMYYDIDNDIEKGDPFIRVEDSLDSLITEQDEDKFQEQKKAFGKGKNVSGSYGVSKPKMNSQNLPRIIGALPDTGSILIFICQTRDNLGFGFEKKTRAGGRALRFYATLEIWSSIREKIKKSVKGKQRVIGIKSKLEIKKNRIVGQDRTIITPIYYSHGFDDLGGCVDYLIDENHWKKAAKGGVTAPEFDFVGSTERLIQQIESNGEQRKLQRLTGKVWNDIQKACELDRKPRYE